MHNSYVRNGFTVLSRVRSDNWTKALKGVQSRPPHNPSTKIPDPQITPPDPGAFPSTLLHENYPQASLETVKAMKDAKARPSSSSAPAQPVTTDGEAGVQRSP